jgi:hypothetical protein
MNGGAHVMSAIQQNLPIEDETLMSPVHARPYSKDEIGMIFWGLGTHLGRAPYPRTRFPAARENSGKKFFRGVGRRKNHGESWAWDGLAVIIGGLAGKRQGKLHFAISGN